MNLPNRLTVTRLCLVPVFIILYLCPYYTDISVPQIHFLFTDISVIQLLAFVVFLGASITDFLDGYIARKYNMVTDFGKMVDAISDKLLTNSVLIILGCSGKISAAIVVVIIARDIVVDSIKMVIGNKGHAVAAIGIAKVKTATLMIGIILTLFYNLPFELISLRISDFLLALAAILSVISGVKYYMMAKPYLKDR